MELNLERLERYKSVAVAAGSAFFAFSLFMFLFSFPPQKAEAQESAATANAAAASSHLRPLEMHIANNGLVLLRSAKVVSVAGKVITVRTAWGSADFIWTIRTNASRFETRTFGTRFIDKDGKAGSLGGIYAGALVTITGALDPNAEEPTIDADSVRLLQ
mgnify:CR=1 FL=1